MLYKCYLIRSHKALCGGGAVIIAILPRWRGRLRGLLQVISDLVISKWQNQELKPGSLPQKPEPFSSQPCASCFVPQIPCQCLVFSSDSVLLTAVLLEGETRPFT